MSWDGKFKYEPMTPNKIKLVMESCKDQEIHKYIMELYELITYQKNMINQQRIEIIALKHKEAWKRYDLPDEKFKTSIDKLCKSDKIGRQE